MNGCITIANVCRRKLIRYNGEPGRSLISEIVPLMKSRAIARAEDGRKRERTKLHSPRRKRAGERCVGWQRINNVLLIDRNRRLHNVVPGMGLGLAATSNWLECPASVNSGEIIPQLCRDCSASGDKQRTLLTRTAQKLALSLGLDEEYAGKQT